MDDSTITIENSPELLMFMRLWMTSGPMVISTVNGIRDSSQGKVIEMAEIGGRDFNSELKEFYSALAELMKRLA